MTRRRLKLRLRPRRSDSDTAHGLLQGRRKERLGTQRKFGSRHDGTLMEANEEKEDMDTRRNGAHS